MTRRTDPARQQSSLGTPQPGMARGRPWAVLIVDPDIEGGRRLAAALAPNATAVVGSARAALDAIRARIPDLIVTELNLPDMPGIDFIARVHDVPATHNVLLLVATQRGSVRDKIAAFQAGADDYLVKPVDAQQFIAHVQLVSRFLQVLGRD
jgi:DNA-binding response OmpR family regulator